MRYLQLVERYMEKTGMTMKEVSYRVHQAKLWHNPLNYDSGESLKIENGWDSLFSEALDTEGIGRRFYFNFHDYDLTDHDKVMYLFKKCRNYNKYKEIWKKWAPEGLDNEYIYLMALVGMTVKGFKNEKKIIEKLVKEGHTVRLSSAREDLMGIDAWVDNKPVQFKSEATAANMPEYINGIRIIGVPND